MAQQSKIEWTDATFNPWIGCTKVSPGCAHCYAELEDKRKLREKFTHWGDGVRRYYYPESHWREPFRWNRQAAKANKPMRVFCASMADILEDNPDLHWERQKLWGLIEKTPNLTWLLLTKRPENYIAMIPQAWQQSPLPHVWLMTTVENSDYMWRIDELLKCPAKVYGVSYEPALGPLDLNWPALKKVNWIIAGGESGRTAKQVRPYKVKWFRDVRDFCQANNIAFLFKQFGNSDARGKFVRLKSETGRVLDEQTWDEYPA